MKINGICGNLRNTHIVAVEFYGQGRRFYGKYTYGWKPYTQDIDEVTKYSLQNTYFKSDITYDYFDILEDQNIRQGLKEFNEWQTYPQLFAKGKFIGGYDIVKSYYEEGTLKSELGLQDFLL